MRRFLVAVAVILCLGGCGTQVPLDQGLALRQALLDSQGCTFLAHLTLDLGDSVQVFSLECRADVAGDISFTVTAPEVISGITGELTGSGCDLTFEDLILALPDLAQGRLAPVTGPWILLHTLRSGYLHSCAGTEEGFCLTLDDSYGEDPIRLLVWVTGEHTLEAAEFYWEGRRILSLDVENFELL